LNAEVDEAIAFAAYFVAAASILNPDADAAVLRGVNLRLEEGDLARLCARAPFALVKGFSENKER
jgi:hypothetical protein